MSMESLFEIIESNPGITQFQLRRTGLAERTIRKQVHGLKEKGKIRKVKCGSTYRLYSVSNRRYRPLHANVQRSEEHREAIRNKVKIAMTHNPRLALRSLAEQIGCSYSIVSTPYHQFKRGEL